MNDNGSETDDTDLFSQAMSDVNPHNHDRVSQQKKPAAIKKRKQISESRIDDTLSDDFIPECGEFLEFFRPGIQKTLLKQIRNGKLPVEDRLDLHGYTRDLARTTLLEFIHHAQQSDFKLVCVVHGKGYHSEDNRPVLKAMVNKWLQNIDIVLAFSTAQAPDGGTGAVYVLIKRLREQKQ
jgi:DNA-nicking Smr family endonuclease